MKFKFFITVNFFLRQATASICQIIEATDIEDAFECPEGIELFESLKQIGVKECDIKVENLTVRERESLHYIHF